MHTTNSLVSSMEPHRVGDFTYILGSNGPAESIWHWMVGNTANTSPKWGSIIEAAPREHIARVRCGTTLVGNTSLILQNAGERKWHGELMLLAGADPTSSAAGMVSGPASSGLAGLVERTAESITPILWRRYQQSRSVV